LSQNPEHVHTVINCQNTLFVNNLALGISTALGILRLLLIICSWCHASSIV